MALKIGLLGGVQKNILALMDMVAEGGVSALTVMALAEKTRCFDADQPRRVR